MFTKFVFFDVEKYNRVSLKDLIYFREDMLKKSQDDDGGDLMKQIMSMFGGG